MEIIIVHRLMLCFLLFHQVTESKVRKGDLSAMYDKLEDIVAMLRTFKEQSYKTLPITKNTDCEEKLEIIIADFTKAFNESTENERETTETVRSLMKSINLSTSNSLIDMIKEMKTTAEAVKEINSNLIELTKDLKTSTDTLKEIDSNVKEINESIGNSLKEQGKDLKSHVDSVNKFKIEVIKDMQKMDSDMQSLSIKLHTVDNKLDRDIEISQNNAEKIIKFKDEQAICSVVLNEKVTKIMQYTTSYPSSCLEILVTSENRNETRQSGLYEIHLHTSNPRMTKTSVYCDMTTDGGGWTIFQRRQDGLEDFDRDWNDYKLGFGDLKGEFWLGNEYLHRMTESGEHELRIDLVESSGYRVHASYSSFKIGRESANYKLDVHGYSGDAGDALTKSHNTMPFTTKDRDNNEQNHLYGKNCAKEHPGGWWFHICYDTHLNIMCTQDSSECIYWIGWKQLFSEMKFR